MKAIAAVLLLLAIPALAATPAQESAMKEIEAFTAVQQKTDPHYAKVEAALIAKIDDVMALPPEEWAPTIKRMYFGLSEKAILDERAAIRADELASAGDPARSPADRYIDRLEALEKNLTAGNIGPREHALHALEAARAIYPQDGALIALREAKVPLATRYELGLLSRSDYDEGWAQARARYDTAAAARDRAILDQMVREAQAQQAPGRSVARGIADSLRRPPAINCTTTPGALGTSTTCR